MSDNPCCGSVDDSGSDKDDTTIVVLSEINTPAKEENSVEDEKSDRSFALGMNIILLFEYINVPDADHQTTSSKNTTAASTTFMHIADSPKLAVSTVDSTCLSSCLRVFKSRLLVDYIIKPITEFDWWKRLFLACLILFAGAYGVFQAVRGYDWDFTKGFDKAVFFVCAKASAALVMFFVTLGILVVLPPVSSSLSEMPSQVLGFIKWRRLHADFFLLAMVCAASHTAFHITRLVFFFSVPAYEYYFMVTGGVLWLLFGAQACHHALLPLLSAPKGSPPTASEQWLKWFFRRSHVRVWIAIAMVAYPTLSTPPATSRPSLWWPSGTQCEGRAPWPRTSRPSASRALTAPC